MAGRFVHSCWLDRVRLLRFLCHIFESGSWADVTAESPSHSPSNGGLWHTTQLRYIVPAKANAKVARCIRELGIRPVSFMRFNPIALPESSSRMMVKYFQRVMIVSGLVLFLVPVAGAQSSRPRRTAPQADSLLLPQPTPTPATRKTNTPLLDVQPVKPV